MSVSVKTIVGVIVAVIIVSILIVFLMNPFLNSLSKVEPENYQKNEEAQAKQAIENLEQREPPIIKTINGTIHKGESIDAISFVESATDVDGNNLKDNIKIQGKQVVDGIFTSDSPGIYYITYSVEDSYGIASTKKAVVIVNRNLERGA